VEGWYVNIRPLPQDLKKKNQSLHLFSPCQTDETLYPGFTSLDSFKIKTYSQFQKDK
jgi:hypothetical protein